MVEHAINKELTMPNKSLLTDNVNVLTVGGDDHLVDKLLHAINHATEIDIAVSFIRLSGLELILPAIKEGLSRESISGNPLKLRLLTSDYLHITQPQALRELMALEGDGVELKIFESAHKSFHMKSYIFVRSDEDASFYDNTFAIKQPF